jgi:hypothetical protein
MLSSVPRKKWRQRERKDKEKVTGELSGLHHKIISPYNMSSREYIAEISK